MRTLRAALLNLVVVVFVLITVAPLIWMMTVSLMPKGTANTFPPPFWPRHPTLANYRALLIGDGGIDYHVVSAVWNSLALAVLATLIGLALSLPAGYALAKLRFRGQAMTLSFLVALAVVPSQIAMLPLFLMLRSVGLVNSYAAVLAPGLAAVYGVLFIRQASLRLPDAMIDAARLDGASEWQVFRLIVLPLLQPVTITLALFTFLASWSDFLWPLIALSDQKLYTLPVALAAISREHAQDIELMMAGAVITTVPVLMLFLPLQRYYIGAVFSGGVKG